jgi:hypothetical protein
VKGAPVSAACRPRFPGAERAADVGDEADADLGHGDLGPVGDHPDVAVCADADSTAHHDAVHEGDIRLGEAADAGVEAVLVEPEPPRFGAVGPRAVVDRHDVPAGAEPALTGTGEDHGPDAAVMCPPLECFVDGADHRVRQRVDRLGPVEREEADPALDVGEDLGGLGTHLRISPRDRLGSKLGSPTFTRGDPAGRHRHSR